MAVVGNIGRVIWGIPDDAPRIPIECPDDTIQVRARFRNDDFARVWFKTSCGIRAFFLAWKDDSKTSLVGVLEQGANYRK